MHVLRKLAVIALCIAFTPGVSELVGDALHVVAEGVSHHSDEHEDCGPEHACTGWRHTCACHVSMGIAPASMGEMLAASREDRTDVAPALVRGPTGVRTGFERPPRA